ncbi:MAG: hypothetical protein COV52_00970 [Gammaproteobacteria bacterium CG11_big_fil_rev_8_21_14_0_20_46_22]|nr:MAG: hypothetical protein COW05_03260 [Gammaproteobacteria bacterium CG12_big_fil_rev_8_21_14_0_65_46_12]PIR11989.1 MAG: hypothetical protein COV52_00970 [Gammaproteobacteria bacterium CG11_big_fil_rev_8_21_14_0_20_46_22]
MMTPTLKPVDIKKIISEKLHGKRFLELPEDEKKLVVLQTIIEALKEYEESIIEFFLNGILVDDYFSKLQNQLISRDGLLTASNTSYRLAVKLSPSQRKAYIATIEGAGLEAFLLMILSSYLHAYLSEEYNTDHADFLLSEIKILVSAYLIHKKNVSIHKSNPTDSAEKESELLSLSNNIIQFFIQQTSRSDLVVPCGYSDHRMYLVIGKRRGVIFLRLDNISDNASIISNAPQKVQLEVVSTLNEDQLKTPEIQNELALYLKRLLTASEQPYQANTMEVLLNRGSTALALALPKPKHYLQTLFTSEKSEQPFCTLDNYFAGVSQRLPTASSLVRHPRESARMFVSQAPGRKTVDLMFATEIMMERQRETKDPLAAVIEAIEYNLEAVTLQPEEPYLDRHGYFHKYSHQTLPSRLVFSGMLGLKKANLASRLALCHKTYFAQYISIDARNGLLQALQKMLQENSSETCRNLSNNPEAVKALWRQWLTDASASFLLHINNLNDPGDISLLQSLLPEPDAKSPTLIISSSLGDLWPDGFTVEPVDLFTVNEAREYIRNQIRRNPLDENDIDSLAEYCHHHPETLSMAIQCINNYAINIRSYIQSQRRAREFSQVILNTLRANARWQGTDTQEALTYVMRLSLLDATHVSEAFLLKLLNNDETLKKQVLQSLAQYTTYLHRTGDHYSVSPALANTLAEEALKDNASIHQAIICLLKASETIHPKQDFALWSEFWVHGFNLVKKLNGISIAHLDNQTIESLARLIEILVKKNASLRFYLPPLESLLNKLNALNNTQRAQLSLRKAEFLIAQQCSDHLAAHEYAQQARSLSLQLFRHNEISLANRTEVWMYYITAKANLVRQRLLTKDNSELLKEIAKQIEEINVIGRAPLTEKMIAKLRYIEGLCFLEQEKTFDNLHHAERLFELSLSQLSEGTKPNFFNIASCKASIALTQLKRAKRLNSKSEKAIELELAEKSLRKAIHEIHEYLGREPKSFDHPTIATLYDRLGLVLLAQAKLKTGDSMAQVPLLKEAQEVCSLALRMRQLCLSNAHTDTARSHYHLAKIFSAQAYLNTPPEKRALQAAWRHYCKAHLIYKEQSLYACHNNLQALLGFCQTLSDCIKYNYEEPELLSLIAYVKELTEVNLNSPHGDAERKKKLHEKFRRLFNQIDHDFHNNDGPPPPPSAPGILHTTSPRSDDSSPPPESKQGPRTNTPRNPRPPITRGPSVPYTAAQTLQTRMGLQPSDEARTAFHENRGRANMSQIVLGFDPSAPFFRPERLPPTQNLDATSAALARLARESALSARTTTAHKVQHPSQAATSSAATHLSLPPPAASSAVQTSTAKSTQASIPPQPTSTSYSVGYFGAVKPPQAHQAQRNFEPSS